MVCGQFREVGVVIIAGVSMWDGRTVVTCANEEGSYGTARLLLL